MTAAGLFWGLTLQAALTVSNLSETTDGYPYAVNSSLFWASSFTTDSQAYNLDSIQLSIRSAESPSGGLQLSVWSGATEPGSSLGLLSGTDNPSPGLNSYTASGISLAANTRYWMVVKVTSGSGTYGFNTTTSLAQSGSWTIGNQPLQYLDIDGYRTWVAVDDPHQFAVYATPVPEPAAVMGVTSLVLVGYSLARRKWGVARRQVSR